MRNFDLLCRFSRVLTFAICAGLSVRSMHGQSRISVPIPLAAPNSPWAIGQVMRDVQASPVTVTLYGGWLGTSDPPAFFTGSECREPAGATGQCETSPGLTVYFSAFVRNVTFWVNSAPTGLASFPAGTFNANPNAPGTAPNVTIPGPLSAISIRFNHPIFFGQQWMIMIANLSFELADPPAVITFDVTDTSPPEARKVLTHRYRLDDGGYPSSRQTEDAKIEVVARVTQANGLPFPGKTVYFRVVDPPDPSPYAVAGGLSRPDDNFERANAAVGLASPAQAVSDGDGIVRTTLVTSDHIAGENYRIEASTDSRIASDPSFACGTSCTKSGIYTTWKRIYVEKDRMFRRGSFLSRDAQTDADRIFVADGSAFRAGQRIRLIHAPSLGSPVSRALEDVFYYEEDHTIATVKPHRDETELVLSQGESLSAFFGRDSTKPDTQYLFDAAGVVSGSPDDDFYIEQFGSAPPGSLNPVEQSFAESFVEMVTAPQLVEEFPFVRSMWKGDTEDHAIELGAKWFENSLATRANQMRPALSNHQHVVSAAFTESGTVGVTMVDKHSNVTYLFRGAMEGGIASIFSALHGLNLNAVLIENAVHELAHQWKVNQYPNQRPLNEDGGGHCDDVAWRRDGTFCHMHKAPGTDEENREWEKHRAERGDGRIVFHLNTSNPINIESEYFTIRRRREPIPNTYGD